MVKRGEFTFRALEKLAEYFFLAAFFSLPFSIALLEIFLSISFVAWFCYKIGRKEPLCFNPAVFVITGFFIIISCVSAFGSGYPSLSARGIVKIIKYVLVMIVTMDLFRNTGRLKGLLYIAALGLALVVADSIVQRVHGEELIRNLPLHYVDTQVRLTGPFHAYGLLGAYLLGVLPIVLVMITGVKKQKMNPWMSAFWIALFIVSVYVLYKTHSRGVWLAFLASWIVYALLTQSKWMIVIFALTIVSVPFVLPSNALIHVDIERKEQSLIERYHLWIRAVQVIQKRPLFGCGINTYSKNYAKFDEQKNWRVPGYYAHNGYLQLAAETGLISLFLFLLIIWKAVQSGYTALQRSVSQRKPFIASVLAGLTGLLLQAGVDTTLHNLQSAVLIWFFLGLLFALGSGPEPETAPSK